MNKHPPAKGRDIKKIKTKLKGLNMSPNDIQLKSTPAGQEREDVNKIGNMKDAIRGKGFSFQNGKFSISHV